MKILLRILYVIYSIVTVFCIFYGFPLMIVNIGRNQQKVFIYMGIFIFGFLLLCGGAVYILLKRRNKE